MLPPSFFRWQCSFVIFLVHAEPITQMLKNPENLHLAGLLPAVYCNGPDKKTPAHSERTLEVMRPACVFAAANGFSRAEHQNGASVRIWIRMRLHSLRSKSMEAEGAATK
jgi:hypothetical protein